MSPGKRWEHNFSKNCPELLIRLYDTTNGFAGIKNPCDFILYSYPNLYLIECKSTEKDKLYFSAITENQHKQLSDLDKYLGSHSIVCVEYRKHKRCFAIPYRKIEEMIDEWDTGLSIVDCMACDDIMEIPTIYKSVNCEVNWEEFLKTLQPDMWFYHK